MALRWRSSRRKNATEGGEGIGYLDVRGVGTELVVWLLASGGMRRGRGCSPDGDCEVATAVASAPGSWYNAKCKKRHQGEAQGCNKEDRIGGRAQGGLYLPETADDGGGEAELRRGISRALGHESNEKKRGKQRGSRGVFVGQGMEGDRGLNVGNRGAISSLARARHFGARKKKG